MANEENLKPFKKGESGNPNGRPKKSFSSINAQLKKEGVEPLKKSDLIDAYKIIFNTSEARLKEIAKDEETPFAMRLIILELKDKKARARALQDYRDYSFGRPKESVDMNIIEQPLFPDEDKREGNE